MTDRVFIGVGHGGSDPGAITHGYVEKDLNLKLAKYTRDYLVQRGVHVMLSRETDEDDKTVDEVQKCKKFKPDISLEIHTNAGGGNGFECFIRPNDKAAEYIANTINGYVKKAGFKSRGVKTSSKLRWVNSGMVRAVLTEGFFLDGSEDSVTFRKSENLMRLAKAYADALCYTLGIPEEEPLTATMTQVMKKYGFAEETVRYLAKYKYGSSLLERLANYGNNNTIH